MAWGKKKEEEQKRVTLDPQQFMEDMDLKIKTIEENSGVALEGLKYISTQIDELGGYIDTQLSKLEPREVKKK